MPAETQHSPSSKLGSGIYTVSDMSRILGIRSSKLRYWLKEYWDGRFSKELNTKYSWGTSHRAVDFYTLLEFYVYVRLREFDFRPKQIAEAHSIMASTLKTAFPFAHAQILTDRKYVYFKDSFGLVVHADITKQINLDKIIEPFCKRIEFGDKGMPVRFWPKGKSSSIVIDPSHQFGLPTVEGTNLLAETVYRMYKAGESKKMIGTLYSLEKEQVDDAISFYQAA